MHEHHHVLLKIAIVIGVSAIVAATAIHKDQPNNNFRTIHGQTFNFNVTPQPVINTPNPPTIKMFVK